MYIFTAEYELKLAGYNISAALKSEYKDQEKSITYNEATGSNVSLICSSGLTGDEGTSRHIQVQFVFWQANTNYTKLMECGTSMENVTNDNWIVGRQTSQPNDCMLTVVGLSQKNMGKYSCIGFLPLGNSLFEKDKSEVSIDLEIDKPAAKLSILYYVLPTAFALVLVIVTVLLIVLFVLRRKKRQKNYGKIFIVCCACQ